MPWVLMDSKALLGEFPEIFNSVKPRDLGYFFFLLFFTFPWGWSAALHTGIPIGSTGNVDMTPSLKRLTLLLPTWPLL